MEKFSLPHSPKAEKSPLSQPVAPAFATYTQLSLSGDDPLFHEKPLNMAYQSDKKT